MKTNYTKEQKETLKLVGILSVCVFVLLVLSIVFMNNLSVPTSTPTPKYIDIDNIEGMNLKDAKALLENADISYEIIPTESKIANKVEKIEFVGVTLSDTGRLRIKIGTTVKIYGNDVSKDKVIYLTFDDGPIVNYTHSMEIYNTTGDLLDILDEYGVKATFFITGYQMIKSDRSEYVLDIINRGHILACHSSTHALENIYASKSNFVSDIKRYENELINIIGEEKYNSLGKYLRFPGGTNNAYIKTDAEALEYINAARELGYAVYDWTALTGDAEGNDNAQSFIATLKSGLAKAKNNDLDLIVLMHDKYSTKEALPQILDFLISEGYYFDTIDNCPEYTFIEN